MDIVSLANAARTAEFTLMTAGAETRNGALLLFADALEKIADFVLAHNDGDMRDAASNGFPGHMLDRLKLDRARIKAMASGLRELAALPDPIGKGELFRRPNGLLIEKRRVPIGVIGIIYEARPNVTADAIGICIKSGNAAVLRGGSEALNSNKAIVSLARSALKEAGLNPDCVGFVDDPSREIAMQMMRLNGFIDVLIPRGGKGLIRSVVENSTVPVIETGSGNCHVYVDDSADLEMASRIVFNAKCSRPAVCNAAEKLLVARSVAAEFLNKIYVPLKAKGVELRGCAETRSILPDVVPATEDDWFTEYDDLILGVKVVSGVEEAVAHINYYNTKHSEAIITENYSVAQYFLDSVDAAAVYVNASTRFTDGGEFGLGAEIGISTQKLHARGPMGLEEMTSYKYCVYGNGQIR